MLSATVHTCRPQRASLPVPAPPTYGRQGSNLVQRAHRHFGDVVGDELPGGTLGVAGGEALAVPQVPCRGPEWLHERLTDAGVEKVSLLLTVFIHGEDRSPAHRELSERLSGGGRDVVPAFSCGGGGVSYSLEC